MIHSLKNFLIYILGNGVEAERENRRRSELQISSALDRKAHSCRPRSHASQPGQRSVRVKLVSRLISILWKKGSFGQIPNASLFFSLVRYLTWSILSIILFTNFLIFEYSKELIDIPETWFYGFGNGIGKSQRVWVSCIPVYVCLQPPNFILVTFLHGSSAWRHGRA